MAAKKTSKRPRNVPPRPRRAPPADGLDAVQWLTGSLARHEASIRQLAEVVVNLHANVAALRAVIEAIAEQATNPRVARAAARLRKVKLKA